MKTQNINLCVGGIAIGIICGLLVDNYWLSLLCSFLFSMLWFITVTLISNEVGK